MYYKRSKETATPEAPLDISIVASAERVLLPTEAADLASKEAAEKSVTTSVELDAMAHHKIAGTAIESGIPIGVESASRFALLPISMFEKTDDGKYRPAGSEDAGFDAAEDTKFVVAESSDAEDGSVVNAYTPLGGEKTAHTATDKGGEDGAERALFDVRVGNKGSVFIGNRGEAGKIQLEITETKAEKEARVNEIGAEAGKLAVRSLVERATKTAVAKEALEKADAKRLREIRREEIRNERPELKKKLSEQKDVRADAKRDLRKVKRTASKRALRRDRRAMVREAMDHYNTENPSATLRERVGVRRGLREVARTDVQRAAAERLAKATNAYETAYSAADATRRRIHEGSRLYAVGGRNTVAENRGILAGAGAEYRGAPGSLIDLEEERRAKLLRDVEAKRVRLEREKYRQMRKHRVASRSAAQARALHSASRERNAV